MVNTDVYNISVAPLPLEAAKKLAKECQSAVGHADTATIFSSVLGIEIPFNRVSISLGIGDCLIIGQYKGPRLPEGVKELPEGSRIDWVLIKIYR